MSQTTQTGKQKGFVTIDQCIKNALMDIGETIHRYQQFKKWALDGYRSFNFDLDTVVKTKVLTLTAWKAVELPDDYVDYVRVGVEYNKQIRVFTKDDRISLNLPDVVDPVDGDPDPIVGTTNLPDPTDPTTFFFYNFDSRFMDKGKLFGLTVKSNGVGEMKINSERREIQFNINLDSATPIYMEYISTGVTAGEKICVNIYAAKLIELYIHWHRLKFSKSASRAEILDAKQDYYTEYHMVQNRLNPLRAEDVMEVMRDAYRLIQTV